MPPESSSPVFATRVHLSEDDARHVLLARAFEEADGEGLLIAPHERSRASERARSEGGNEPVTFLARRAAGILAVLEPRSAQVPGLLRATAYRPSTLVVVALAALVGLSTNALGDAGKINVIAFPLLGIVVWNLAMYVLLVAFRSRSASDERAVSKPRGIGDRLTEWYLHSQWTRFLRGRGDETVVATHAATRFLSAWRRTATPLLAARLKRTMHMGALALAIGAVGGMYLRGLAFEYKATWESTFLSEPAATRFLEFVLWPATALMRAELPALSTMRPPDGPPGGGPAAIWIHLYAVTVALFVVVPRALLAWFEGRRAARRARGLAVDVTPAYFRRLLSPGRGDRVSATVVPYSYRPNQRSTDNLKTLLHDVFGARAEVQVREVLEYGAEASDAETAGRPGTNGRPSSACQAVLFTLAQPPEVEVHGCFLEELKDRIGEGECMVVLVDGATYRERLVDVPGGDDRLDERRRAWDRVIREAGLVPVHVELDHLPGDELVSGLAGALYPPDALPGGL